MKTYSLGEPYLLQCSVFHVVNQNLFEQKKGFVSRPVADSDASTSVEQANHCTCFVATILTKTRMVTKFFATISG